MKWFNRFIVGIMPIFPKSFIWLFSRRYVAGKTLESALEKVRELNRKNVLATIDVLGEDIESLDEATQSKEQSIRVLNAIAASGINSNLSVKLTSLGLRLDKEACYRNVREIVQKAAELKNFVRIDMEDVTTTDDTLAIYGKLRKEFTNVGAVIQAYLKRSSQDVDALIKEKIAHLRICKGIYNESPEVAYKDKEKIRMEYNGLIEKMLKTGSYVGIATHDKTLIEGALSIIEREKRSENEYEFQMLLGVTEKLRQDLVAAGHRLRVYVPFGEHWYGYSMRRLKENPNMAGHIIKNLFIRG